MPYREPGMTEIPSSEVKLDTTEAPKEELAELVELPDADAWKDWLRWQPSQDELQAMHEEVPVAPETDGTTTADTAWIAYSGRNITYEK